MALKFILVVLTDFFISKATSSLQQPYPVKSYIMREPRQQNPCHLPYTPEYKKIYPNYISRIHRPIYRKAAEFVTPPIPKSTELHQPIYQIITDLSNLPTQPLPKQVPFISPPVPEPLKTMAVATTESQPSKTCTRNLDSTILNNLAIALQLLIINNIISNPKSESVESVADFTNSLLELASPAGLPINNPYNANNSQLPNAKFLGSSNIGNDNIMSKAMMTFGSGFPLPRPGVTLMSPYDAIASSTIPEPDSSLYALKNDFQSPYAAIMAADNNRNLFSMSDLF